MKTRNADIEFLRFVMIFGVVMLHFQEDYVGGQNVVFLRGGYLGVDFFYIVSGFFLYFHFCKNTDMELRTGKIKCIFEYLLYRVKQLYVPYMLSIFLYQVVCLIEHKFDLSWLVNHIWETRWQYIMLHYVGPGVPFEFRAIWFIPSLIIVSYFLYACFVHFEQTFISFCPVLVVLMYAYIWVNYGSLSMQFYWTGLVFGAILRAFAGMSTGVYAAWISLSIDSEELAVKVKLPIIWKIIMLAIVGYIMLGEGSNANDFTVIPAMFVLVIVCYVKPCKLADGVERIVLFMGKISLWIYFIHLSVSKCMVMWWSGRSMRLATFVFAVLTVAASAVLSMVTNRKRRMI